MFIRFAELPVVDQDRAAAFYTEKLGMRLAEDRPYEEDWRWITLEIPGARTKVLLTRKADGESRNGAPSLVLTVDDVHALCRELNEKGVEFTTEPQTAPWDEGEVYAVLRDSEGNLVMIGTKSG